jgi:hypothetical protein
LIYVDLKTDPYMGMDQYLLIPFLVGWTSIYQLFWCSPGVQGFDTLPHGKFRKDHLFRNLRSSQSPGVPGACPNGGTSERRPLCLAVEKGHTQLAPGRKMTTGVIWSWKTWKTYENLVLSHGLAVTTPWKHGG